MTFLPAFALAGDLRLYAREVGEFARRVAGLRHPHRYSYVICASPRSGSGLLSSILMRNCLAGRPAEHFRAWEATRTLVSPDARMKHVLDAGMSYSNGIFGLKVMWHDLCAAVDDMQTQPQYHQWSANQILRHIFPNIRYIHISRLDSVAQAVSWAKAEQTGEWFRLRGLGKGTRPAPTIRRFTYDFEQIARCHDTISCYNKAWNAFFAAADVQPFRIVYEELVPRWRDTAFEILGHIGVPPSQRIVCGTLKRARQFGEVNAEWARRFKLEYDARPRHRAASQR